MLTYKDLRVKTGQPQKRGVKVQKIANEKGLVLLKQGYEDLLTYRSLALLGMTGDKCLVVYLLMRLGV